MKQQSTHENSSARTEIKIGSNRSFGFVFAAFFALLALLPLLHGHSARWWALGIAAVFAAIAILAPHYLAPLNRVWFRFGLILHKYMSPVVLGLMFYGVLSPFALMLRLLGKRPLTFGFDRSASSYWIERTPPGPPPQSMTHQF